MLIDTIDKIRDTPENCSINTKKNFSYTKQNDNDCLNGEEKKIERKKKQ